MDPPAAVDRGARGGKRMAAKKRSGGEMTVREAGRKGGRTTKERHGPQFYETIGQKGGEATREKHGPQFYETIGKKGGQRVRELVEEGKKATERHK